MSLITQYSRISHHTISGSMSATFSVPTSEDFTDGTWTTRDLALSEFGVNEDSKKLYVRINDEVKEIQFAGATGGGAGTLSDTLALGNTTGANWINVNSGYGLQGTYSTIIDTISIDPEVLVNGTGIFSEDGSGSGPSGAITSHITIQSQTPNLMSSNGTDIGTIDVGPGYVNMYGNDGSTPITDTISIDPKVLGNGTGIKSVGGLSGNTSQTLYTPDTIISTTTDVTNTITDTISLDPQGSVNGTGIFSEDATNNQSSQLYLSPSNQSLNLYDTTFTNYNVGLENNYDTLGNTITSKIDAQNTAGISVAKVEVSVDLTVDKSQIDILADTTKMSLPAYADDATAGTASLTTGALYQTDGTAPSPLNVAGIVMIKQ